VSQISPPVRIVAVVAIAFLAIYMVALRPKSSTPTPTAAAPTPAGNVNTGKPAVTQFGKAVQQAQGAAKATEKQGQSEVQSAGDTADSSSSAKSGSSSATRSTTSQATTTPVSAVDVKGLPRPVANAVRHHKVVALLFTNSRSTDDRMTRAAFRHVLHLRGAVYTQVAPLDRISRYARITRGADVTQSPTVVVVDRHMKATTLVGYVDTDTIDQAVVDAMRASGTLIKDPYLQHVNNMCSAVVHDLYALPQPTTIPQARHDLKAYSARWDHFYAAFQSTPAPGKWRSFKRQSVADLRAVTASNHRVVRDFQGHTSRATLARHLESEIGTLVQPAKRFTHRMDRAGLIYCGSKN
jgi:hypothetical protein